MYSYTFRFVVVLYLLLVASVCYAGRSKFPNAAEKVEILKHLKIVNKPPVKFIKSPDGDIIDCVNIYDQPSLDHPSLKNHTIKMKPDYQPNWIKDDKLKVSSMMNGSKVGPPITQLWHSNGKCPKGTIPIRRTKMEDILRAGSVKNYQYKKTSFLAAQPNELGPDGYNHEYATLHALDGPFYGTKVTINVWNPRVEGDQEFSLAQLWLVGGTGSYMNTIEAGWHVNPFKYSDTNTRFFIFSTTDGYDKVTCYNLDCPQGFIQTNNDIVIGGSISPVSQMGGSQYDITIIIVKDPNDESWWMQVNGQPIGYWPPSWFTSLSNGAPQVSWGGEVVNKRLRGFHTTTQMGSGRFPVNAVGEASYFKNIQIRDEFNNVRDPKDLRTFPTNTACYDIKADFDDEWGTFFLFGGPGLNENCQ